MKRTLKWLAIVLTVSLLGFGTALLLWPRDRITVESWQKIRIGMTEKEVEEILRGAGMSRKKYWAQYDRLEKDLGRRPCEVEGPSLQEPKRGSCGRFAVWARFRIWTGGRGIIFIELDQENRVCCKEFQGARWTNGGILDRLRDWLGW